MVSKTEGKLTFSFAGCGFMSIYHLGVVSCLQKYLSHFELHFAGASAGALAAASLLCGCDIGNITRDVLKLASDARSKFLGPFSPTFSINENLKRGLEQNFPEDAHLRVNGKLYVSVTRAYDRKNVILKQFNTREEFVQALLCSSFVPFFSGILPPKFRNVRYMDGGITDNLVILDEDTITVSPFGGESDICPRDYDTSRLMHVILANTSFEFTRSNVYRLLHTLLPANAKTLADMCQQGFDDTKRFLQYRNLIGCLPCVYSQPFIKTVLLDNETCADCKVQQQSMVVDSLPQMVSAALQNAITTANEEIISRIFQHQNAKLLSILSLPFAIPVDVAYAVCLKLTGNFPRLGTTLGELRNTSTSLAKSLIPRRWKNDTNVFLQCNTSEVIEYSEQLSVQDSVRTVRFDLDFNEDSETELHNVTTD